MLGWYPCPVSSTAQITRDNMIPYRMTKQSQLCWDAQDRSQAIVSIFEQWSPTNFASPQTVIIGSSARIRRLLDAAWFA